MWRFVAPLSRHVHEAPLSWMTQPNARTLHGRSHGPETHRRIGLCPQVPGDPDPLPATDRFPQPPDLRLRSPDPRAVQQRLARAVAADPGRHPGGAAVRAGPRLPRAGHPPLPGAGPAGPPVPEREPLEPHRAHLPPGRDPAAPERSTVVA